MKLDGEAIGALTREVYVCILMGSVICLKRIEAIGLLREASMPWYDFVWNTGVNGNASHVAEHGIEITDVESVVCHPLEVHRSRSTGRPIAIGWSSDGRLIAVVYEQLDPVTVYPITAFEVEE